MSPWWWKPANGVTNSKPSKRRERAIAAHPVEPPNYHSLTHFAAVGGENEFRMLIRLVTDEHDRAALARTCWLLRALIPIRVGLSAETRRALSAELPPHVQLRPAPLSVCSSDSVVTTLADGSTDAGIPHEQGKPKTIRSEEMLSDERSRAEILQALHHVSSMLPPGLIPFEREAAIARQVVLAHDMGLLTIETKDDIPCFDVLDLKKLAGYPELADAHEMFTRVYEVTHVGRSVSSGGGTQVEGNRLHFRQPLFDRGSTPGDTDLHMDGSANTTVLPEWVARLWEEESVTCMLMPRFCVTLEVPNVTDLLLPRCGEMLKVSALAAGAPMAMGVAARGTIFGEEPQVVHGGATRMMDGSVKPRVIQLVFDMFLADMPAMAKYLAVKRMGDLLRSPKWGKGAGLEDEVRCLAGVLQG